jgi:hypothetical protein
MHIQTETYSAVCRHGTEWLTAQLLCCEHNELCGTLLWCVNTNWLLGLLSVLTTSYWLTTSLTVNCTPPGYWLTTSLTVNCTPLGYWLTTALTVNCTPPGYWLTTTLTVNCTQQVPVSPPSHLITETDWGSKPLTSFQNTRQWCSAIIKYLRHNILPSEPIGNWLFIGLTDATKHSGLILQST